MKKTIIPTAIGLLVAALPALAEPDPTYQFTSIAESGGAVVSLAPRGLNNRGDVLVFIQSSDGTQTLALGDGGPLRPSVTVPRGNSLGGSARSLSDSGRVCFLLGDTDPTTGGQRQRVVVAQGGQWSILAEGVRLNGFGLGLFAPVMNNEGVVAFRADEYTSTFQFYPRIYMTDGGPLLSVVEGFGDSRAFSQPEINNDGVVAYNRSDWVDSATGVYLWQGGAEARVFDPNSQPGEIGGTFLNLGIALNDFGSVAIPTVAWMPWTLPDGQPIEVLVTNRIVRVDGGVVTTIAARTEEFRPASGVSMNNAGIVAFNADDAVGRRSLYVGDGIVTRRLVGTGDLLLGRTVSRVFASLINESGQQAFLVNFSNGSRAVVLATPKPTPRSQVLP